jgi:hypothetical protein
MEVREEGGDEGEAEGEEGDEDDPAGNIITATPQERELDDIEEDAQRDAEMDATLSAHVGSAKVYEHRVFRLEQEPPILQPFLNSRRARSSTSRNRRLCFGGQHIL